jgi:gentisate 1,2-dioxygenase
MSSFADKISPQNLSPLWDVMSSLITPTPKSNCQPFIWHYDEIRPAIMQAGEIISAKEAVRRVLILENPGLKGRWQITTSLYAGLQLVLPGEVAPCHRHSQTALRFVLEGSGAHTAVDGERTFMEPGDFVITPSQAWHDHGNTSDKPMVWLDGLDIPMVQFFDASFVEDLGVDEQPVTAEPQTSLASFGQGLLPIEIDHQGCTSPVFNYSYEKSRAVLEKLARRDEWDPHHGLKLHYANPLDGGYAMATMATFLQYLPKGFASQPYRSTDATVFVCVEGRGTSTIGDKSFSWSPRDIFIVPSWHKVVHQAGQDTVLFSYSDRAAQEKLGLWREEKLS